MTTQRATGPQRPDTGDPTTTEPSGGWPTNPIGYAAAYGDLDDQVPVLFSPVRIETRFTRPVAGQTRSLRVRIYPDQFHLDEHDPRLTAREVAIGEEYWRAWSTARGAHDEAAQTAAR
jgi:hypothetical protein